MSAKPEDIDPEEVPIDPAAPLKEAISLKDLMKGKQLEFSLKNEEELFPEEEVDLSDRNVETAYSFDDWQSQVNFDCIALDDDDSKTPFEIMREKMTPVCSDRGVMKEMLVHGTGDVVPPNSAVYVHYNSYHEMEEVPFDTTYLRCGKPVRIQFGYGSTILGFEMAVQTMKKGEKSRYLIQPQYAYGKMGVPPRIKENATILIVIELINFVDSGEAKQLLDRENELKADSKKFEVAYRRSKSFQSLAKDYFQSNNIKAAIDNYRKAENLLHGCILANQEEEDKRNHSLIKIYTNLAVCYNNSKINLPHKVCTVSREAFRLNAKQCDKNSKLLYQWGKALSTLCDYKKANEKLVLARRVSPEDADINQAIHDLKEKERKALEDEKITYKKAFGFADKVAKKTGKKEAPTENDNLKLDAFETDMRNKVKAFVHRATSRIQLPAGISEREKMVCRKIAKEFGINFEEKVFAHDGRSVEVQAFSKYE